MVRELLWVDGKEGKSMNEIKKLKKEICLGRLIWVQTPSNGSALFFAKRLMNGLGVQDQEMVYLSAEQFVRQSHEGFPLEFFKSTRVLLIGNLEKTDEKTKRKLFEKLVHHKAYKHLFDINLVLVSASFFDISEFNKGGIDLHPFQMFGDHHPIRINEKIHDWIEGASLRLKKPIWKLSGEAAHAFEESYRNKGEDYAKRLISLAVKCSKNKGLSAQDVDHAHQLMRFAVLPGERV